MAEVIETVWIPMPDGPKLAAWLWLPDGARDDSFPAIAKITANVDCWHGDALFYLVKWDHPIPRNNM